MSLSFVIKYLYLLNRFYDSVFYLIGYIFNLQSLTKKKKYKPDLYWVFLCKVYFSRTNKLSFGGKSKDLIVELKSLQVYNRF